MPRKTYGHRDQLVVQRGTGKWTPKALRGFYYEPAGWKNDPPPPSTTRRKGAPKLSREKRTGPATTPDPLSVSTCSEQEGQWAPR